MKVKPMGMLLMMLAGWINRHQQDVIMKIRVSLVQDSTIVPIGDYPEIFIVGDRRRRYFPRHQYNPFTVATYNAPSATHVATHGVFS